MIPAISAGVELERLHAGAGNAGRDDADEFLIGHRVPELAAAQIDAADAVAVGAVAGRALRVVEPRAVGDVGRRVFTWMCGLAEREARARQRHRRTSHPAPRTSD